MFLGACFLVRGDFVLKWCHVCDDGCDLFVFVGCGWCCVGRIGYLVVWKVLLVVAHE